MFSPPTKAIPSCGQLLGRSLFSGSVETYFSPGKAKNPSATKGNNKVPPPKTASYTGGEDEPFHFIAISPLSTVRLLHTFDRALLWRRRRTWRGNGLQLPFASPFSLRTARRLSVNINLIAPLSAPNSNRLAESDQGTYPGDEQNGVTAQFSCSSQIASRRPAEENTHRVVRLLIHLPLLYPPPFVNCSIVLASANSSSNLSIRARAHIVRCDVVSLRLSSLPCAAIEYL